MNLETNLYGKAETGMTTAGMVTLTERHGESRNRSGGRIGNDQPARHPPLSPVRTFVAVFAFAVAAVCTPAAHAEDGHELWLRYHPIEGTQAGIYRADASQLVAGQGTPTQVAARDELLRGLGGLLGAAPPESAAVTREGAIVIGTVASSPLIAGLGLDLDKLGAEGYLIRSTRIDGHRSTVIAAREDIGVIYGAFHFLRLVQTGQSLDQLDVRESPHLKLRLLNHWDDLDGHVERGYAGASIWDWH